MTLVDDALTASVIEQPHSQEAQTGLIRSARIAVNGSDTESADTEDDRWYNGISFRPEDCDFGGALELCGDTAYTDSVPATGVNVHYPFVIEASVRSSTFCERNAQEEYDRARRKLLAVQSFRLERELWAGTTARANTWTGNQYLNKASPDLIEGGSPLGTLTALAELEQYLAEHTTERGMIHAQRRTVTYWLNNGAVSERNGLIVTALGTIIVPGAGYPGTGPTGAQGATVSATNADKTWAYATSLVQVRLGPIFNQANEASEVLDRSTNRWLIRSYRVATANFSPCARGAAYINHSSAERTVTGS